MTIPRVDLTLARRLERAEGTANAAFVESRRALQPEVAAEWIEVAGTYAMFDGAGSPLTQTFGLGLFEPFGAREFDRVEQFFHAHGSATSHEVSAFAPNETLSLLGTRGYSPIEASVVLVRGTTPSSASSTSEIAVRAIDVSDVPLWSRVSGAGWGSESPELSAFVEGLGAVVARARGVTCFLAEIGGEPIAAGALNVGAGIALLSGASTVPSARRRGAQLALLEARLAFAAAQGIDVAMIVTQPGSASQRNAERRGFRAVYTRAKWERPAVSALPTP